MKVDVYTDASSLTHDDSRSGIGVVVCLHGRIFKTVGMYVGKMSSTEAEVMGILQGLREAEMICMHTKVTSVVIICDCMPALDMVVGETQAQNEDIQEMLEAIDEACIDLDCPVVFQWVKSHNSNEFNELADKIAYEHAHN